MEEIIWYTDLSGECPECNDKYNLGTAQNILRSFNKEVDIVLPCGHNKTFKMITKSGVENTCSYSQLDLYLQCPKRWMFKYVDKIIFEEKSKHLEYGLTIHETLEEYFLSGRTTPKEQLLETYNKIFNERKIPFDDFDELETYYQQGITMVNRLYNPVNEVEKLMAYDEIIGVEKPFEIVVNGIAIIGYIDLVVKTKDGIVVIDHKSSKKTYDKAKLQYNFQFPIYDLAILQEYGEIPINNMYNFTRLNKCQGIKHDQNALDMFVEEIAKILKKMKKDKHGAKASPLCYWCSYSMYQSGHCKYSSDWKPKNNI